MDAASALEALELSFTRPSATPCLRGIDHDLYVREEQQRLRSHLIKPLSVKAVASQWAQKYAQQDSVVREYIALAHANEAWLLYNPESSEFAKAYGNPSHEPLSLLGFASGDALAEWLG